MKQMLTLVVCIALAVLVLAPVPARAQAGDTLVVYAMPLALNQVIVADTGALAPNRVGDVVVSANGAQARFAGIPGFTYTIERSTDGATWSAVGSVVVPANGLFEFLDSAPPAGSVFYRTTVP